MKKIIAALAWALLINAQPVQAGMRLGQEINFGVGDYNTIGGSMFDKSRGFLYIAVNNDPGKIVKVDIATMKVAAELILGSGDISLNSCVIDPVANVGYFSAIPFDGFYPSAKIIKINLDGPMSKLGELRIGGSYIASAAIDSKNEFAYFATYEGYVKKIRLSPSFELVATTQVVYLAGDKAKRHSYSLVLDEAKDRLYFGRAQTRLSDLQILDGKFYSEGVDEGAIDVQHGIAYSGSPYYYNVYYRLNKINLADGLISKTVDFPIVNTAFIDQNNQYIYFGTTGKEIIKLDTDLNEIGRISLPNGEGRPVAAFEDSNRGYAYFVSNESYAPILRSNPFYNVDPTKVIGFKVVRVELSNFTRKDSVSLDSGLALFSAVKDSLDEFAYFGSKTSPGKVLRLGLSDLTTAQLVLDDDPDDQFLTCAAIDDNNEFAYFGTEGYDTNTPARVIQINLKTFQKESHVLMDITDGGALHSAVVDSKNGFAYFGTNSGKVIRFAIGAGGRLTRAGDPLALGEDLVTADLDETRQNIFFNRFRIDALSFTLSQTMVSSKPNFSFLDKDRGYFYYEQQAATPNGTPLGNKLFRIKLSDNSLDLDSIYIPISNAVTIDSKRGLAYLMGGDLTLSKIDLIHFKLLETMALGHPFPSLVVNTTKAHVFLGARGTPNPVIFDDNGAAQSLATPPSWLQGKIVQVLTIPPPTNPEGLTLKVISQTQVELKWQDKSDNEDRFVIERSRSHDALPYDWEDVATVPANATTFIQSGLPFPPRDGVVEVYRIRVENEFGSSASTVASVRRSSSDDPLAYPTHLKGEWKNGAIHLTWDDNSIGESGYKIIRTGGKQFVKDIPANSISYKDEELNGAPFYQYSVLVIYNSDLRRNYPSPITVYLPCAGIFSGGDGTRAAPFGIKELDQLISINGCLDDHFELLNDIVFDDANTDFTIGNSAHPFHTSFDGHEFKIFNFKHNTKVKDFGGFFGVVNNAEIKNLSLIEPIVLASYAGGLAGYVRDSSLSNIHIRKGTIGFVDNPSSIKSDASGGLVGQVTRSDISLCSVENSKVISVGASGGIVGAGDANIFRSFAIADMTATGAAPTCQFCYPTPGRSGGLFGVGGGSIVNSFARSTLSGTDIGGLIGKGGGGVLASYASSNSGGLFGNTAAGSYREVANAFVVNGSNGIYWDGLGTNAGNTDPVSFFHKTNPPLDKWDFDTVWTEVPDDFPVLRQTTVEGPVIQAPTVTLINPTGNEYFDAPAQVTIEAQASDPNLGGSISKVEYWLESKGQLLGFSDQPPYRFDGWKNIPKGTYILVARATNDKGRTSASNPVEIKVHGLPIPPQISIVSPASLTQFDQGLDITIEARIDDPDQLIAKVGFFYDFGNRSIGDDENTPFRMVWKNAPSGNHTLVVKALDSEGNVLVVSEGIPIQITGGVLPPISGNSSDLSDFHFEPFTTIFDGKNDTQMKIRFYLPFSKNIDLLIFNQQGLVRRLFDGEKPPGVHEIPWDTTDDQGKKVASGSFKVQLIVGGSDKSEGIVVAR